MDSVTRQALRIVLDLHELTELERYRREAEQDLAWRCEFEAVFAELNNKFATVEEDFISFTNGSAELELGVHGGNREDMVELLEKGEKCFVWAMWIKPIGACSLRDTIISWGLDAFRSEHMRHNMASYIRCVFPNLVSVIATKSPLAFDTCDEKESGEDAATEVIL